MNNESINRMKELVQEISRASYAYYVLDNPYISDMQWDRMYDELRSLEAETGIILPDSPTRQVGGETLKGFEEHVHLNRLWSMDKVQSLEGLDAWIARTEKLAGRKDLEYFVEYKFDGLTLNLTYDRGQLIQDWYLDDAGQPCLGSAGYAGKAYGLDRLGRRVSETYLGLDGKPILGRDGYAGIVRELDQLGNETIT